MGSRKLRSVLTPEQARLVTDDRALFRARLRCVTAGAPGSMTPAQCRRFVRDASPDVAADYKLFRRKRVPIVEAMRLAAPVQRHAEALHSGRS